MVFNVNGFRVQIELAAPLLVFNIMFKITGITKLKVKVFDMNNNLLYEIVSMSTSRLHFYMLDIVQ